MSCEHEGCSNQAEDDKTECFRHRVLSVGYNWRGGAHLGKSSWNQTQTDFMIENFGTTDDRELGKRGVERAS